MEFDQFQEEDCTATAFLSDKDMVNGHQGTTTVLDSLHSIFPENLDQFNLLCNSFRTAEERVKEIEWRGGLDIPSINELRYVGFHLIKAVQAKDSSIQDEQLRRAFRHCRRAEYDAVELGILSGLDCIARFQDIYRSLPVIDHVKNYPEILGFCEKLRKRQENSIESEYRESYYEEIHQDYIQLVKYVELLQGVSPELDKKQSDRKKENLKWKVGFFLSTFVALTACLRLYLS